MIVAIHPAGDTQTLAATLEQAMLDLIGRAPTPEAEMVADPGYHSRVKALEDSAWKSPRKSRRLLPAGTATTRLAGTTTGRG